MAGRRRRLDPVGPFGNPDGSRADIEDLISEFVDFGGDPAFGHLATRANDSMVRVIVGKLGAGKTVYLRRLQDFQSHQDSVYADAPQQSLPKTEVVVKACQWFSDQVLVEKWMQIWDRAIMRSLTSHLLTRPELRQQLRDEQIEEIQGPYARLLDDFRRPRSIYSRGPRHDQPAEYRPSAVDVPRRSALGRPGGPAGRGGRPVQAGLFLPGRAGRGVQPRPDVLAEVPGGVVLPGHAAAPGPQAGRPPAHRGLHPRHRDVVGVPVGACAAVLQRTAHPRPDLGPQLAALPAAAQAGPAAAVTADAARRHRPAHDQRLARGQRPLAGTRRRRADRGLPAQPHQADPARHHLARQ